MLSATCMFSNLPIHDGEEVICFPIYRRDKKESMHVEKVDITEYFNIYGVPFPTKYHSQFFVPSKSIIEEEFRKDFSILLGEKNLSWEKIKDFINNEIVILYGNTNGQRLDFYFEYVKKEIFDWLYDKGYKPLSKKHRAENKQAKGLENFPISFSNLVYYNSSLNLNFMEIMLDLYRKENYSHDSSCPDQILLKNIVSKLNKNEEQRKNTLQFLEKMYHVIVALSQLKLTIHPTIHHFDPEKQDLINFHKKCIELLEKDVCLST